MCSPDGGRKRENQSGGTWRVWTNEREQLCLLASLLLYGQEDLLRRCEVLKAAVQPINYFLFIYFKKKMEFELIEK